MSKKIGMVAFRSSASGISVISNIGPTMPGMKQILFWPEREEGRGPLRPFSQCTGSSQTKPGERKKGGRIGNTIANSSIVVHQETGFLDTLHALTLVRGHASSRTSSVVKGNDPACGKYDTVYKGFHLHRLLCKQGPDGPC